MLLTFADGVDGAVPFSLRKGTEVSIPSSVCGRVCAVSSNRGKVAFLPSNAPREVSWPPGRLAGPSLSSKVLSAVSLALLVTLSADVKRDWRVSTDRVDIRKYLKDDF